ncbi:Uncharacterised protein [uncultured archaeon]|nr:Uncharacterised protein [uncultured archaeon]
MPALRRKGYVLMWDAFISLSFIFMIIAGAVTLQYFVSVNSEKTMFRRAQYTAEDAMEVLNKKGVLEEIGITWYDGDKMGAANIARTYLESILPPIEGYRLTIDGQTITESNSTRPSESLASDQTRSRRLVSGFAQNESKGGWTARAYLEENISGFGGDFYYAVGDLGTPNLTLQLDADGSAVGYVKVPVGTTVDHAAFTLRWANRSDCNLCPMYACNMPEYEENITWQQQKYYNFTLNQVCSANVTLITYGEVDYDLYVRWDGSCPYFDDWMLWGIDPAICVSRNPPPGLGGTNVENCYIPNLAPGTYYAMADYWEPYHGPGLGVGGYNITVKLSNC